MEFYCLQCDVCDDWFHVGCKYDDPDAYDVIVDNDYAVICSNACYMKLMPFHSFKFGTLVKSDIFNTSLDNRKKRKSLNKSQNSQVLTAPSRPAILKDGYKSQFVKYDRFLDINCTYLNPNDLNDSVYGPWP